MMKVLAVTPTFFPQVGGLEQVVLELAQRVRSHGVVMDIAHVATSHTQLREESMEGIRVLRVPLYGHRMLGYVPQLARLARDYELLHAHDPQLLAITQNLRMQCRALPAVLSTHGGFWHTDRHAGPKRLYERTLLSGFVSYYQRVLATSGADLDQFRRHSARVVLCGNGVHVQRFSAVMPSKERQLHRWIYWGRLSRNKRLDRVIHAAAQARQLGHPIDLLICGRDFDGLKPELAAQVEQLGLRTAVQFVSFLSNDDLLRELNGRGVYITASEHEGFGLGIVEAMAAGLVVLCRDIAPLNGFVENGASGRFLRFDGSEADDKALHGLLALPASNAAAMSARARTASAAHDWPVAAQRFVHHYHEVLDEFRRAAPVRIESSATAKD